MTEQRSRFTLDSTSNAINGAVLAFLCLTNCPSARADHYDSVLGVDFNKAKKELSVVTSMVYQDVKLDHNEMYIDDLLKKKHDLKYRLSPKNVIQFHVFSNPQARRNDNIQISVNSKPITTMEFNLNSVDLTAKKKTVLNRILIKESASGLVKIIKIGT